MAYEKTTWVDGETPITAENLNKMEQGIVEASQTGGILTGSIVAYDGDTIPEGYEEVENLNNYSTEETFAGKYWIDGKKIYRKVWVVTELTKDGSEQFVEMIPNVSEVIKIDGLQRSSSGFTSPVPTLWGNDLTARNSMIWVDVSASGGYFKYKINSGWSSTSELIIIAEYTKKTD